MLKRYIGDKAFYRTVMIILLPLVIQLQHFPDVTGNCQLFPYGRGHHNSTQLLSVAADGVFFVFLKNTVEPEGVYYPLTGKAYDQTALLRLLDVIGGDQMPQQDPVMILCTGRFSHEKSQEVLLEAMKYSKYADRIQLHFAGRGPLGSRYKRMADRLVRDNILKYIPVFGFYTAEDLEALARRAYLYIHCAWVEVEGLSCVEALKEGAVPVIAKGPYTAAWRFALDDRSIFPVFDAKALAERIDWWIEHPQERMRMGKEYAESIGLTVYQPTTLRDEAFAQLLAQLSGKTAGEIADLNLITLTRMIKDVFRKPEFTDFFGEVFELFS